MHLKLPFINTYINYQEQQQQQQQKQDETCVINVPRALRKTSQEFPQWEGSAQHTGSHFYP